MYLTDKREDKLVDVITKIEPHLFKKVTGLTVDDFNLLLNIGLFRDEKMNVAVQQFRKYEDSSLSYVGINRHEGERVGYFNTVVDAEEFEQLDL